MRALFDVNVLIAVLDDAHIHHWIAQEWWASNRATGWATCPLTENGMVRIMSQPNYKNRITAAYAIDILGRQVARTDHAFWPDDVSLRDAGVFDPASILGPNQVSDVYLLALAVKNGGRLVTLDRAIPVAAVHGAKDRHLVVLGLS
jgi:toxin-antitoxin system PIN domain toxin